ncbi:hypothetical protein Q0M94_25570 (plasmid) [Deinococcus radiomollis]|uniref:hypothetical protein n=1 Tax=Deinococcus radiomollis TaxID=468916 RepID=UPI0038919076
MNKVPLLALLSSAALAAPLNYRVVANGQVVPQSALVVGGVTYVPLSALTLLGVPSSVKGTTLTLGATTAASTTPGGANQKASLEGCLGEALFNGVWRLTVNGVKPIMRYNGQQKGYSLALSWKNGTTKTVDALNTGVKAITLVLADGNSLTSENDQDLKYKALPQAAGATLELSFWADSAQSAAGLGQPSKLLIDINASTAGSSGVAYSTTNPSFRVRLDCQK